MLGSLGMALARDQVGGCRDDGGMGQEYDLEGDSSDRRDQSASVPKGSDAEPQRDAGGRSSPGAPPGVAQMGYPDPPDFNRMMKDILLKKSP